MSTELKQLPKEIQSKMERYRTELLAFDMREPTMGQFPAWHWLFYKPMTELTAFVVNLKCNEFCVEVIYGYTSTTYKLMLSCII